METCGMERWFAERRKSKVLDLAHRQITLAIDTVTDLERSIRAVSDGERAGANRCIERLFVTEEEIDDLRRTVFEELTKGSLPLKSRQDLMELVTRLDVMADRVKDAGRSVKILMEARVPRDMWAMYVDLAKALVDEATVLRGAIEKLGAPPPELREILARVDTIEHEIDEKYLRTKALFIGQGGRIDAGTLLILKDALEYIENAADMCADTADYIRTLAVGE